MHSRPPTLYLSTMLGTYRRLEWSHRPIALGMSSLFLHADSHLFAGVPHASVFTFNKEDHTLGNMITSRLHQNPHIHYAGYKVPHPLFR